MGNRLRLGVLVTHPVQYFAPLFRTLASDSQLDIRVYYAHRPTAEEQGTGFGVAFEWDVDLLGGYDARFLHNVAPEPGGTRFAGYDTPEIGEIIRTGGFDAFLVLGWQVKSYWQAIRACWATGTPVLVRGDSQLGAGRPSPRAWARRLTHRRFIPRFFACLAVGQRSAEYFRFYGARRIVRSPHFVDNAHFARGAAAAPAAVLRREWGVPDGRVVAGFVGKLIPEKRPVDFIEGIAASGREDVHAVYVGDGELRPACEEAVRRLGVPTTFAGFMNQRSLPGAYAAIDFLVLPSGSETWGLVVNEAMACGRPVVVSTAAGCAPDLVREGVTGYTFPAADVQALGERIARLAADAPLRARMGDAARVHIAGYSVDAAAAGVREALDLAACERAA